MVQLHSHLGQGGDDLRDVLPDGVGQKGRDQVLLLREVVDSRAVEQHGGTVHGNAVHNRFKGGLGAAGGHGKDAAVGHEILDGGAVLVRDGGHIHALLQGLLGVDKGVVEIADQQQAVEFTHDLRLRAAVGLTAAASAAGRMPWMRLTMSVAPVSSAPVLPAALAPPFPPRRPLLRRRSPPSRRGFPPSAGVSERGAFSAGAADFSAVRFSPSPRRRLRLRRPRFFSLSAAASGSKSLSRVIVGSSSSARGST